MGLHFPTEGPIGITLSLGCVLLWYIFSIGLTFYNKWMFKTYGLNFPLVVTSFHMLFNFFLSWALRMILLRCGGKRRTVLSPSHYFKLALPTGAASALDVGLGNTSLSYITISLYTICKSTSIIFLLLFAFCFGLEKPRLPLTIVIFCIAGGVLLFTWGGSPDFNLLGFILVMSATVMSGLRWVLTQLMLQKKGLGLTNPVDTLYHVTPTMALILVPLALGIEGIPFLTSPHMFTGGPLAPLRSLLALTVGGVLAFGLNWAEFLLISRTSSVTMSVAGIFKELCTIGLSVWLFGDHMSLVNIAGMVLTIVGIILFNILKYRQTMKQSKKLEGKGYSILDTPEVKPENKVEIVLEDMERTGTEPEEVGGQRGNATVYEIGSDDDTTEITGYTQPPIGQTTTTTDTLLRHRSHSLTNS